MRARRLALKRETLMKMPLFQRLSEREILRVMQVAEVIAYQPGQVVVREGDRGDELFIVLSGMTQIARGETVLNEAGAGEHFGEMALIRAMPRSATVSAVEPTEIIAIRRADFFEILRKEHELAVKLLWQFLGVLADRLEQTSRDLSSARQELAAEDITDAIFPDLDEPVDLVLGNLVRSPPPDRWRQEQRVLSPRASPGCAGRPCPRALDGPPRRFPLRAACGASTRPPRARGSPDEPGRAPPAPMAPRPSPRPARAGRPRHPVPSRLGIIDPRTGLRRAMLGLTPSCNPAGSVRAT